MFRKCLLTLFAITLLLMPGAMAHGNDIPSVMVISAGASSEYGAAKTGMLNVLQSYGFINEAERATLDASEDLAGDNIGIYFRAAEQGAADASALVEKALDQGVHAIVAIAESAAQTAVNLTSGTNRRW